MSSSPGGQEARGLGQERLLVLQVELQVSDALLGRTGLGVQDVQPVPDEVDRPIVAVLYQVPLQTRRGSGQGVLGGRVLPQIPHWTHRDVALGIGEHGDLPELSVELLHAIDDRRHARDALVDAFDLGAELNVFGTKLPNILELADQIDVVHQDRDEEDEEQTDCDGGRDHPLSGDPQPLHLDACAVGDDEQREDSLLVRGQGGGTLAAQPRVVNPEAAGRGLPPGPHSSPLT